MITKKQYNITTALSAIYFLAVVWIILFKMGFSLHSIGSHRSINLIPFGAMAQRNGFDDFNEVINNIIIFMPFGIYLCMLKQEWSFIKKVAPLFLTSLALEIFQYIFAIGATDITDLLANILGGIIGIGIFTIFMIIFRDTTYKIVLFLALLATVVMVVFLSFLLWANSNRQSPPRIAASQKTTCGSFEI